MFSELALRGAQDMSCRGPLEDATHYGESDPPGEGPYVQIWLIVADGVVKHAHYKSPGCPSSSACGGVLCTLIAGREVSRIAELEVADLLAVVGELPEGKGHYADRTIRALRSALQL